MNPDLKLALLGLATMIMGTHRFSKGTWLDNSCVIAGNTVIWLVALA